MINQIPFTRHNYHYTQYFGKDENGQSVEYWDRLEPDETTGLPVRYEPDETLIKRARKGAVAYIITKYRQVLVGPNGNNVPGTETIYTLQTNEKDKKGFIDGPLCFPIMMFDANGFIRGVLGFNDYPLFETSGPNAGSVLVWTPEQEAEAPDFAYHTPTSENVDVSSE